MGEESSFTEVLKDTQSSGSVSTTGYCHPVDNSKDWNYSPESKWYGWICPKCGKANGPHINSCDCVGVQWPPYYHPPVYPYIWEKYEEPAKVTWYTTDSDGTVSGSFQSNN